MTTITQYLEAEVPDAPGECRILVNEHGYAMLYTPQRVTL